MSHPVWKPKKTPAKPAARQVEKVTGDVGYYPALVWLIFLLSLAVVTDMLVRGS